FYRRVFGFEPLEPGEPLNDQTRLCPMRAGDRSVLLLFKKGATADTDAVGAIHIAFGIARCDLPAWERRLKEQGISIELRKTWKYGGEALYFRDPDGHLLDKVIQTENDYDKDAFNGDVGIVERVDPVEQQVAIRFDDRIVKYDFGELDEVSLAYAVTIHKSQGSEFPAVVIPLATQHYMLLERNLIYTGITRGKNLVVLVGQKKALGIAVRNDRPQRRYSGLLASLRAVGVRDR